VLFDEIASVYFILRNVLIYFSISTVPVQGTGTVPIASAHCHSLLALEEWDRQTDRHQADALCFPLWKDVVIVIHRVTVT